jgi:hypothetical protein
MGLLPPTSDPSNISEVPSQSLLFHLCKESKCEIKRKVLIHLRVYEMFYLQHVK